MEVGIGVAAERDLSYALNLLASGRTVKVIWKEAGFASRMYIAHSLFELAR